MTGRLTSINITFQLQIMVSKLQQGHDPWSLLCTPPGLSDIFKTKTDEQSNQLNEAESQFCSLNLTELIHNLGGTQEIIDTLAQVIILFGGYI